MFVLFNCKVSLVLKPIVSELRYCWGLNNVPGSGQTNDDGTSLMQICHNNNSNNNNYNSNANYYFLA